jgi:A/G-specific adenine glycosylase
VPPDFETLEAASRYCGIQLDRARFEGEPLAPIRHGFTHFDLEITPICATCEGLSGGVRDDADLLWYDVRQPPRIGLPAPIATLLGRLGS